ncbi:MAG: TRM11 family SAM-dependent methyltransferase [Candidatus Njordarchaeia archaeon]
MENEESKFLVELSGDQTEMGMYEIKSILDAYGYWYKIIDSIRGKFYLIKGNDWGFWLLSNRGAYIKNIWKIIGKADNEILNHILQEEIRVKVGYKILEKKNKTSVLKKFKEILNMLNKRKYVPMSKKFELTLIDFNEVIYLAYPLGSHRKQIGSRNPKYRNYAPSATMDAYLSRALVNFSRAKPGDIFLDPFAGSGSIAMEAASIGCYTIALDKSIKHLLGLEINRRQFNLEIDIIVGDATNLPIKDNAIDSIATDPPYGRSAATFKRQLEEIYGGFLREAARVLRRGKYLVFCAPKGLAVTKFISDYGFEQVKTLEMKVHHALTRVIHVLTLT